MDYSMVRTFDAIRLVVELICKVILMGFCYGLMIVAAFQASPFVAIGVLIVFVLAISRSLLRKS